MDKYSYDKFFEKGNKAQELVVDFMESVMGRRFIAGDRNGETINIDVIEEIARCSYIPPNSLGFRHGARLSFFGRGDANGYTMPDELFITKSSNRYEFMDVKNRTVNTLSEKYWKIENYAKISEFSGIDTYVAIVIWNTKEKGYDIFIRRAVDILTDNSEVNISGNAIFYLEKFQKINKKSIKE